MSTKRSPCIFLSHGSPSMIIERDDKYHKMFKELISKNFSDQPKPSAIICISAHWETRGIRVNTTNSPKVIYDFGGFPAEMYRLQYPCPGSERIGRMLIDTLNKNGVPTEADPKHGLDHGAWVPLSLLYPEADIPVLQLSLHTNMDPILHYKIGRALSDLREASAESGLGNLMFFGSGGITHNLMKIMWAGGSSPKWATDFDNFVNTTLTSAPTEVNTSRAMTPLETAVGFHLSERDAKMIEFQKHVPSWRESHPSLEHFMPLFVTLGLSNNGPVKRIVSGFAYGSLSMAGFKFE